MKFIKRLIQNRRPSNHGKLVLELGGLSDIGLVRSENQDALLIHRDPVLIGVADGMGGHVGGQLAANETVEQVKHTVLEAWSGRGWSWSQSWGSLPAPGETPLLWWVLQRALFNAHDSLHCLAARDPALSQMGTTFTGGTFEQDFFFWIHVGDSRFYLLRNGQLNQMTQDENYANYLRQTEFVSEEVLSTHPGRNWLCQNVGGEKLKPNYGRIQVCPGDILLISSDGLHGSVSSGEIRAILEQEGLSVQFKLSALIRAANREGGCDNISALVVEVT